MIKIILENLGIDPDRFRTAWVSSAEAPKFAEIVTSFIAQIKSLGPNPLKAKRAEAA